MITLMDYDFHGFYDGFTGANAPLYSSPADTSDPLHQLNVVSFSFQSVQIKAHLNFSSSGFILP